MGGKTFRIENSSWKKLEIEMQETTPVPSVTGLRVQDTEERGKKIAKEKHLGQKTAIITAVGHIAMADDHRDTSNSRPNAIHMSFYGHR